MLKSYLFNGIELYPVVMDYTCNGNTAIELYCKENDYFEPYINLSVNFDKLSKDMCYIDTNHFEEAEAFIKKHELGYETGLTMESGFCTYPLYIMDTSKMNTLEEFEKRD